VVSCVLVVVDGWWQRPRPLCGTPSACREVRSFRATGFGHKKTAPITGRFFARWIRSGLLGDDRIDVQLLELLGGDRRGRLSHQALALLGLGEGDDIADARRAAEQGAEAVETERDAAVRGRAVAEGLE